MFTSNSGGKLTHLFVRSNIHMANLDMALKKHLHLQKFVDVTLSCEGRTFKCHRLILAAASPLFENLLNDSSAQHPIVIMPLGIKAWTIQALIDFMYKGQVNVSQYGLKELVRSAELLQISGLDSAHKNLADYCYKDLELENDNDSDHDNLKDKARRRSRSRSSAYFMHDDSEDITENDTRQDVDGDITYDMPDDDNNDVNYDDDNNGAKKMYSYNYNDVSAEIGSKEHQQVPDESYRFEIATDSSDTIVDETEGQQSCATASCGPEAALNDSGNMFSEEQSDSGLPDSPATTICNMTKSILNSNTEGTIGKIRVKPCIKLFDKTTKATTGKNKKVATPMTPFHVKVEEIDFDAERIICQPSVSAVCNAVDQVTHDQRTIIDVAAGAFHNNNREYAHSELLKAMLTQESLYAESYASGYEARMPAMSTSLPTIEPILKRNSKLNKLYYSKYSARKVQSKALPIPTTRHRNNNNCCLDGELSLQTVILRNPRSNQPRSYSNEALYNALMAVKHGESIYRSSREYQVPRKTLRNWMKRWDIKSQYPMPKQLKDAATKKKLGELQQ